MTDWPEVKMADTFADQQFFADHPERRYRSLCSQCVAALKPPPPNADQQHLELLRATRRDYR